MKSKVVLIPCQRYDADEITEQLNRAIALLGGWEAFCQPDARILLKPNLLKKASPEQAITTHPAVFEAVIRSLKESGRTRLSYGDSPGHGAFGKAAEDCGLAQVAKTYDVSEGEFGSATTVSVQGKVAEQFVLCNAMLETDCIINLCKMKTHALERITGAVKNMYGAVFQINKGLGHTKFPNPDSFAEMLIDLNQYLKPRLHIMDGIVAMEGNGPASGTPVSMNVLLVSADAVALDTVFCHLIHLDPALVPTNVAGERAGYGTTKEEDISLLLPDGSTLSFSELEQRFSKENFAVIRDPARNVSLSSLRMIVSLLDHRPAIKTSRCIRCGICVQSCPLTPKAVQFPNNKKNKVPKYDYDRCIRCFCCQEMCPQKAIYVKQPFLGKFFH